MNNLEQVEALRQQMLTEGTPRPDMIRQLALACLGWPYVFGAWGEKCSPEARKRRARAEHPTIVSKCPALNGRTCADCKWGAGVRMYDCRGFTAWLLRQVGLDLAGQGATSQWRTAANWERMGPISEMPDTVCCVFKQKGQTMEHTGMHVGGGLIIHCSVNVQTGQTTDRGWTHYAIPAGLGGGDAPVIRPTVKKGSKGETVKLLQGRLNELGYDCGKADGIFGAMTQAALQKFQKENGLEPDGICGRQTWDKLQTAEKRKTYLVKCAGMTWDQVMKIMETCPTAEVQPE